jgi:hypothetical protein
VAAERLERVERVEDLAGLLRAHEALVGGRLDEAERHRVDPDAVLGQLDGEVLRQDVAAGLRGGVGARRRGGDRVDGPHRADVHDGAAATLAHRAHDGLRHPERRAQDRAERLLEVLLGLLFERHRPEDPGAVDQDVHAAEALHGHVDQCLGVGTRRDVTGVQRRALAGGVELGLGGLEDVEPRPAQHDARARVEEAARCRAPDAAAPAGDEDDLVLEVGAHGGQISCRCIYCKCS